MLFVGAVDLAVVGFGLLWLRVTRASGWLGLIVGSWDVLASATGGNVELILLGLTLLAAWWLWSGHTAPAALPIAVVMLITPFYLLFFVAFGVLLLSTPG
jgi:hypothetical protein